MSVDSAREPRWVTRVLRLFPHPVFGVLIALACLAVAMLMVLAAGAGFWLLAVPALIFGAGAFAVFAAIVIRRRCRRRLASVHRRDEASVRDAGEFFPVHDDLRGHPPIPTSHLLFCLAMLLVVGAKAITVLLSLFGGIQLPAVMIHTLTALFVLVTASIITYGVHDFERLCASAVNAELTGRQVAIVVGAILALDVAGVAAFFIFIGIP